MSVFRVCCPCCVYGDIVATFLQDTEGVCCAGKWGLACCGYYSVGLIPYVGHVLRCGELCVFVNVFVCVRTFVCGCLICSDPRIPTLLCPTRRLKHTPQVKYYNARPTCARPLLRRKLRTVSRCVLKYKASLLSAECIRNLVHLSGEFGSDLTLERICYLLRQPGITCCPLRLILYISIISNSALCTGSLRGKIRAKHGIEGDCCGDCLTVTFCSPCSLVQVYIYMYMYYT